MDRNLLSLRFPSDRVVLEFQAVTPTGMAPAERIDTTEQGRCWHASAPSGAHRQETRHASLISMSEEWVSACFCQARRVIEHCGALYHDSTLVAGLSGWRRLLNAEGGQI